METMAWTRLTCKHCQVQYGYDRLDEISTLEWNSDSDIIAEINCPNCDNTFEAVFTYTGNVEQ